MENLQSPGSLGVSDRFTPTQNDPQENKMSDTTVSTATSDADINDELVADIQDIIVRVKALTSSRENSLAVTKLEESYLWLNKKFEDA